MLLSMLCQLLEEADAQDAPEIFTTHPAWCAAAEIKGPYPGDVVPLRDNVCNNLNLGVALPHTVHEPVALLAEFQHRRCALATVLLANPSGS